MWFPRNGTWATLYSPLLWHFYKEDGTRLCDGSSACQYTPGRAPRMIPAKGNRPGSHCEVCLDYARQRRRVYGWANAGTDGRSEHWPPLQGPGY